MNLQEILNYRTHCLICKRIMKLHCNEKNIKVLLLPDGLKIRMGRESGLDIGLFRFDGTFMKGKHHKLYNQPIHITKECPKCFVQSKNIPQKVTLKSRSVGATTMAHGNFLAKELRSNGCSYSFTFYGDSLNNYAIEKTTEYIRYHNKIEFYHVNTNFATNGSTLLHAKFTDSLDTMLQLDIPALNLSKINDLDHLINKFKLYTLFS